MFQNHCTPKDSSCFTFFLACETTIADSQFLKQHVMGELAKAQGFGIPVFSSSTAQICGTDSEPYYPSLFSHPFIIQLSIL